MVFTCGVTIWILAILLVASAVGMGWRQGAIRAAVSFAGIVFAALLAAPIGKIFKPLLPHLGVHSAAMVWAIAPVIGFVLVLALFKSAGYYVHHKVEMFYKYKAGDLRLSLWERLNHRLGACVGVLNGTAYFVLVCFFLFNLSYWTAQVAPSDAESWSTRLVNRLGRDLQSTGVSKPAEAVAALPDMYYRTADLAGLICQNPQLTDRLADYPPFISIAERDDIQQLAQDGTFTNAWFTHGPMGAMLNESQVQALLQNQDLISTVWGILQTNMDDLTNYLMTGKSPKYDSETILGRWDFNPGTTVAMITQARPNITPAEMRAARAWMTQAYAQTVFIVGSDNQAFLKNLPHIKTQAGQPSTTETATWKGQWSSDGTNYDLTLSSNGENKFMSATTDGTRLTIKDGRETYIFDREE
jgi:hypothetical protein